MTRKDYVAIAAALKQAHSYSDTQASQDFNCGLKTAANRIADHFAADNARFDRARFLAAAGVQS